MNTMKRAIYGRWKDRDYENNRFIAQEPQIQFATQSNFEFSQDTDKNASPNGLVWCEVPEEQVPYEISVNGKKQGITKKHLNSKKSSLKISKLHLFEEFYDLIKEYPIFKSKLAIKDSELQTMTYDDIKGKCVEYRESWKNLKKFYFQQWTTKPEGLLKFNLTSSIKKSE